MSRGSVAFAILRTNASPSARGDAEVLVPFTRQRLGSSDDAKLARRKGFGRGGVELRGVLHDYVHGGSAMLPSPLGSMQARGMNGPKRILLTGGGTAGHVNPALAIGKALAADGARLLFVGVRGRAEAEVVPREGIPIRFVRASAYPGARLSLDLLRFLANLSVGVVQAGAILLTFRPDVIVGTGGFASAPVLLAAAFLRRVRLTHVRIFVHEQNATPGKLNQLVGRLADRVFVTFPETLRCFPGNAVVTGYPLRRRIAAVDRDHARAQLDFTIPSGRQVVFVFGGSQGARTINRAIVDALGHLLPIRERLFIVHGTGLSKKGGYDPASDVRARLESRYSERERAAIADFYVAGRSSTRSNTSTR